MTTATLAWKEAPRAGVRGCFSQAGASCLCILSRNSAELTWPACASEPCPLEHACSRFPTKNDVTSAAVLLSKESDEGEKESPVHSSVGQGGHTWPRGRTPH